MMKAKMKHRAVRAGIVLGVLGLALTGCATSDAAAQAKSGENNNPSTAANSVTIEDAWVKSAESGMTAAFGELLNDSDGDVTVVSVESAASPKMELHETVDGTMREVEGGFQIPANGQLTLAPGGNHLMLMDLPEPLLAGQQASFTLTFSDGSTFEFPAVVKDYSGANENYEGDMDHEEMDHGDMEHDESGEGH